MIFQLFNWLSPSLPNLPMAESFEQQCYQWGIIQLYILQKYIDGKLKTCVRLALQAIDGFVEGHEGIPFLERQSFALKGMDHLIKKLQTPHNSVNTRNGNQPQHFKRLKHTAASSRRETHASNF